MKASKPTKTVKKSPKAITAEEFDAKFERGEDVSDHVDWANAEKFVNVPFPLWMVKAMDDEARRLGINRQALIKVWIADRIEQVRRKVASNL